MRKRGFVLLLLSTFVFVSAVCLQAAGTESLVVSGLLNNVIPTVYAIDIEPTPSDITDDPNKYLQPDTGTLEWNVVSGYYFAYFNKGDTEALDPDNFQRYLDLLKKYGWTQICTETDGDIQKITLESRDGECMLMTYDSSKSEGAFYYGTREGFGDTIIVPTPDPNATPTPTPTETSYLSLDPLTQLQPDIGSLDWTMDRVYDYYKAAFKDWGGVEHLRFTNMLASKGWTLINVQGDNAADRQIHTFQSSDGEYIVIDWDRVNLTGTVYYGTADRLGKLLVTPTPDPNATPTPTPKLTPTPTATPVLTTTPIPTITPTEIPTPSPEATPTPLQGVEWPSKEFPPYVPSMQSAIVLSLDLMDAYSGISFTDCTEEDFFKYIEDMEANGWSTHSFQINSDQTQFVQTGKTDLGEYLSIYWNSQTGEGKIYYGTKDSIPVLD